MLYIFFHLKKKKKVWLFDQISKKIENISTNPDSAASNFVSKYAHYLCICLSMIALILAFSSYKKLLREWGYESGIKDLSQIDLLSDFCTAIVNFLLSKVHKFEVFTNSSILHLQHTHGPSLSHMSTHRGNQAYVFRHVQ